jgi:uncharacterized protein (DUF2225 family)
MKRDIYERAQTNHGKMEPDLQVVSEKSELTKMGIKCRHCETEMESSNLVDLTGKILFVSIKDKLPFKEPKPTSLQFWKCPKCGYTEMFLK